MRNGLDFDLIFPIKDETSARLMLAKALGLLQAGEITLSEAAAVFRRASEAAYGRRGDCPWSSHQPFRVEMQAANTPTDPPALGQTSPAPLRH